MTGFDFDRAVRWARFNPGKTLSRRSDQHLPLVDEQDRPIVSPLLFDTSVYIDGLQGKLEPAVQNLIRRSRTLHSTVAVQELMYTVGRLDPSHPSTKPTLRLIGTIVKGMHHNRIFAPDADVLGRAALLSGILCRLQGYQKDQRLRALHDCVLYLQAMKLGVTVLTANVADFDYLLQLLPAGKVLLYRTAGVRGSLDP